MGQRRRGLNVQAAKIRRGGYLMGRLRYAKAQAQDFCESNENRTR